MEQHCNFLDILRGPKILDLAIFDLVSTFLASMIICWLSYKIQKKKITSQAIMMYFYTIMLLVVLLHYFMDIPTMLNYYIGLAEYIDVLKNRKICQ